MEWDVQTLGLFFGPTGFITVVVLAFIVRRRRKNGNGNNWGNKAGFELRTPEDRRIAQEFRESVVGFQAKMGTDIDNIKEDVSEMKGDIKGISRESTATKTALDAHIEAIRDSKRPQGPQGESS